MKYSFAVVGTSLIVLLDKEEGAFKSDNQSYKSPSFVLSNDRICLQESGVLKQEFTFHQIESIDGVIPTDLDDAFNKLIELVANFNGGGTAPTEIFISVTKPELDTLITNSELVIGATYEISNCQPDLYGGTTLILEAVSASELSDSGMGVFYNPNYNNTVDGYGIYDSATTYFSGDFVIWGVKLWEFIEDSPATDISNSSFELSSEYTNPVPFNIVNFAKVYNPIKYDYAKDFITERSDYSGNIVKTNKLSQEYNGYGNIIKLFQWGNDFDTTLEKGMLNVVIDNAFADIINFKGNSIFNTEFKEGSAIFNTEFEAGSVIQDTTFGTNSIIENKTIQGNNQNLKFINYQNSDFVTYLDLNGNIFHGDIPTTTTATVAIVKEGSQWKEQEIMPIYLPVTKAEIDLLISQAKLIIGTTYLIFGCDPNLYGGTDLVLEAVGHNKLAEFGTGIFRNPKYNQAIAGLEIYDWNVSYGFNSNVFWGGKLWRCTNIDDVPPTTQPVSQFELDPANWVIDTFTINKFVNVTDSIGYDYANDYISQRSDKSGNIVKSNFANSVVNGNPIKAFQWGNDYKTATDRGVRNVVINNSYLNVINAKCQKVENIIFEQGGYFNNNTLSAGSIIKNSIFSQGTSLENKTFVGTYENLTFINYQNSDVVTMSNIDGNIFHGDIPTTTTATVAIVKEGSQWKEQEINTLPSTIFDDQFSTGSISGGNITLTGGIGFSISAGLGYIKDGVNKYKRITWGTLTGSTIYNGDNFISIDYNGNIDISSSISNLGYTIPLAYVRTNTSNTGVTGFTNSKRYPLDNFQKRVADLARRGLGSLVVNGMNIAEQLTPNFKKITMGSGSMFVDLEEKTYPDTSIFTKLYNTSDNGFIVDSTNPNEVNTLKYNEQTNPTSTALVNMTLGFWKKDVFFIAPSGSLFYVYGQTQYATEELAKKAPIPTVPSAISRGVAFLATIVCQNGDATIANRITDIRPILSRLFETGSSSIPSTVISHNDLTDLNSDDHPQYHTDGRGDFRYYKKADVDTLLNDKEPTIAPTTSTDYYRGDKTFQPLNKSAVGLSNVDNTSDVTKSVLSATKLTTARTINTVPFDGTSNIVVEDSTKLTISDNLSDLNSISTARTNLGLGTLATQNGTFSGTSSGTNTGDNAPNSLYSGLVTNATHTGEVTGDTALTITNNVVTNTKLANVPTKTYKGRTSASTGIVEDVPITTLKTDLALTKSDVGLANVQNVDTTTTTNIADATNKRFVTDAEKTKLANTSGINTGDNANTTGTASNITATTNSTLTSLPNLVVAQSQVTGLATTLAGKEPTVATGTTSQYYRGDKTFQTLDKSAVGLANVDNTSDANKNVLSATKLTTARTINTVPFDGTANITIADSTKLAIANNLSDLNNAGTARTNLGLGTLATQNGTFSGTSSGINTGDETTATIQTKRPLKTINGNSLEGTGNLVVGQPTLITLPTNYTTTSITRADIPEFVFPMVAGGIYVVEVFFNFQTVALTTGVSLGFTTPTGTATITGDLNIAISQLITASNLSVPIRDISLLGTLAGSSGTSTGVSLINSPHTGYFKGIVKCSVAGTFQVQFGSEVALSTAQLNQISTMLINKLN